MLSIPAGGATIVPERSEWEGRSTPTRVPRLAEVGDIDGQVCPRGKHWRGPKSDRRSERFVTCGRPTDRRGIGPSKETSHPVLSGATAFPGREIVYFQGPGRVAVPHRSKLLDEERGTGRRRPVAGPVDRDEGDRVIASLGNVYDGSITGGSMV